MTRGQVLMTVDAEGVAEEYMYVLALRCLM